MALGKEINASIQLESVLKRMLAYKPGDRYQNAAQILTDLPSPSSLTKPPTTHLTKIKTMVVSPGRKVTVLASKLHNKTQAVSQKLPLPVWLRPFAVSFGEQL